MEKLLSVKDVSNLLSVSESMVWKLIRQGELVPVGIGTRKLFREDDIDAFTMARRQVR